MKLLKKAIMFALLLLVNIKTQSNAKDVQMHRKDTKTSDKIHRINNLESEKPTEIKPKSSKNQANYHGQTLIRRQRSACQHGQMQSPIDVTHNRTVVNATPFIFKNYTFDTLSSNSRLVMKNTGTGVRIHSKLTSFQDNMVVSGGGLPGKFRFGHIDFHWGSTSEQGSEHHIEGRAYPMEVQIVHHSTRYSDMANALSSDDSNKATRFAVFSIIMETSRYGHSLDLMLNKLNKIKRAGDDAILESLDLEFPFSKSKESLYYQYNGSLTTPPCDEGVMWFVLKNKSNISEKLLEAFRRVFYSNGTQMVNNFRPIQPRYNREIVLYSYDPMQTQFENNDEHDTGNGYFMAAILGSLFVFVAIGLGILTVFCSTNGIFRRITRRSTTFQELSHELWLFRNNSSANKSRSQSSKNGTILSSASQSSKSRTVSSSGSQPSKNQKKLISKSKASKNRKMSSEESQSSKNRSMSSSESQSSKTFFDTNSQLTH